MRCKICKITIRAPPMQMRETQICRWCSAFHKVHAKKDEQVKIGLKEKKLKNLSSNKNNASINTNYNEDNVRIISEKNKLEMMMIDLSSIDILLIEKEIEKNLSRIRTVMKKYFKLLELFENRKDPVFKKLYVYCKMKYFNLNNDNSYDDTDYENILKRISDNRDRAFIELHKDIIKKWSFANCLSYCQLIEFLYPEILKIIPHLQIVNQKKGIESESSQDNPYEISEEIDEICKKMINSYRNRPNLPERNIDLLPQMLDSYIELGSMKEISKYTGIPTSEIRIGFRNLVRVPKELKKLHDEGRLGKDHILSSEIVIFATDYYFWDGVISEEKRVIELALKLRDFIYDEKNLSYRKEFFTNKIDYTKPIRQKSQINLELKEIYVDWPVKISEFPFDKFKDRSINQYRAIVFYRKNPDAARFVRRWEYEKGKRIPKSWANEILQQIQKYGNANKFIEEHSNEFKD